MRDVIPLLDLLKELSDVIPSRDTTPNIHCTILEDNKGCIDLANSPRVRPSTKHIALKYHYFRSSIKSGAVSMKYIEKHLQIADILTKALNDAQFCNLRKGLNGW